MKILVTGGGGFLGRAIVRLSRELGHEPRVFGLRPHPELEAEGVQVLCGDIADYQTVHAALEGCDAVVHTAAMVDGWGRERDFRRVNVTGTRNIIEACRTQDVRKLVYTSSPSVVCCRADVCGADESAPYAPSFDGDYPRTKAIAEKLVLAANGEHLFTVALRPHLIVGPGERQFVPRMVKLARAHRLRLPRGPAKLIDWTYIADAARAHLLALERLGPGASCAGKAYFISQGQPLPMIELFTRAIAAAGGEPLPAGRIPPRALIAAGWLAETVFYALRIFDREPPMTRYLARQLTTAHWFDIGAARRDLGFSPDMTFEGALSAIAAASGRSVLQGLPAPS
jgi:nucleoside-diphosphate-sugar epimerase